jgi:serine/threonine-protein kinase
MRGSAKGLQTVRLHREPAWAVSSQTGSSSLRTGVVVAERYELEQPLGEGAMGEVWSARDRLTNEPVALKFLKGPASPDLVKRFVREAKAASAVRHSNVIAVHDIVVLDGGTPAIVMDLLRGETLASHFKRLAPLSVTELSSIMVPILAAVGAAHAAGIVHRDLKPDNIFLAEQSDGSVQPMVLDFGVCKLRAPEALAREISTLTVSGSLMGTPLYMSPEQVFAAKDVDARADVWALGVILYEGATGQRPFEADSAGQLLKRISSGAFKPVAELAPQAPAPFAALVQRMLAKERDERPRDLLEPLTTLCGFTSFRPSSFAAALNAVSPSAAGPAPKKRLRAIAFVGAAAALALVWLLGAARSQDTDAAPRPSSSASDVLPAAGHDSAAPTVTAPVPAPSAAPTSSASSPRARASNARVPLSLPSRTPKSETLAGGVHGEVPF